MTGPPYPFPVSSDPLPPFDWWATVVSQYANAPILTAMISNFYDSIQQNTNIDAFFDLIWNVDTAQGYGLDVWGRIVGVSRILQIPGTVGYLVFNETGESGNFSANDHSNPDAAPFFGGMGLTQNFVLSDAAFRVLIFAKALANISDGSIKSINALLLSLFPGRGNCYVADGLNMTMQYRFVFTLTTPELAIVLNSGALPRPTGVSFTIVAPAPF